jgi:hypothetical protein
MIAHPTFSRERCQIDGYRVWEKSAGSCPRMRGHIDMGHRPEVPFRDDREEVVARRCKLPLDVRFHDMRGT